MATRAHSPQDLVAANWGSRIDSMLGAGLPKKKIIQRVAPVALDDIRSVKQGGQPMGDDQAVLASASALRGKPVLTPNQDQGWSPDDLWGDVQKDVADLTFKGIPALARYATHIPQNLDMAAQVMSKGTSPADTRWLKQHGFEPNTGVEGLTDPGAWASAIRNVSKTPIFNLIPGLHTAAELTTSQGRNELAHHPVSTTLDVLPVAQTASHIASLPAILNAPEGGALEAAYEAKPLKALYRATVPEEARAAIGAKTVAGLRKIGFDPASFGLARGFDTSNQEVAKAMDAEMKNNPVMGRIAELPDEERNLLTQEAAYPDQHPDITPEHQVMLEQVDAFNKDLVKNNPRLTSIRRNIELKPPEAEAPSTEGMTPEEANLTNAQFYEKWRGDRRAEDRYALPENVPEDARFMVRDAKGDIVHTFDIGLDPEAAQNVYESAAARRPGVHVNVEGATPEPTPQDIADRARIEQLVNEEYPRASGDEAKRAIMDEAKQLEEGIRKRAKERPAPIYKTGQARKPPEPTIEETTVNTDLEQPMFHIMHEDGHSIMRTPNATEVQPAIDYFGQKDIAVKVRLEVPERRMLPREQVKPTITRDYIYPTESTVAKAHSRMLVAEERAATTEAGSAQRMKALQIEQLQREMKNVDRTNNVVSRAERRVESARKEVARAQQSAEVGRGQARTLDNSITRLQKAMDNLETRKAQAAEAGTKLENPTNRSIEAQTRKVDYARERALNAQNAFEEEFRKNPPANMVPMLERIAKEKALGRVSMQPWALDAEGKPLAGGPGSTTADFVEDATKQIERADLRGLMTSEEWTQLRNEVMHTWQDVAEQGYHPVWSHNVDVERAGTVPNVKPLSNRVARISQIKERVGDLTPKVEDIAVSMGHSLAEYLKEKGTNQFLSDHVQGVYTRSWDDIAPELHKEVDLMRAKGKIPRGVDEAGALQIALNKGYVEWNPEAMFETTRPKLTGTATVGATKTYLPRNIAKILDDLIEPYNPNAYVRAAGKVSKIYKTSIMQFSLKHMAHIQLGGMMMVAMRGGVEELMNLGAAWKMAREGEMPAGLNRHLDIETPDQLFQVAAGNKMGELYAKSLGGVAKAKYKLDEFATNFQRSLAYLGEESRAVKKGYTPGEAAELGLRHANKTLVDLAGMNPFERNVLRQVFPFYSFMRHTLRYALTYPIDHPLRASILANVARIEQGDWSSGLPDSMQSLFFLGTPNANGDINTVEMKQFNPFRDTGTYFTFAGFFKALHPGLSLPFTLAGMDKFTGSPSLYPEVDYDPQTGNLVAKRPKNAPLEAAETIVPEIGALDHFFGLTQEMRDLKASNPDAYKKQLWNMLFLPFHTQEVNVGKEAADIQSNLLKITQQDVSNSLRTGRTGAINQYPLVPYQGELVQPSALTNVIDLLKKIRPDSAPRSVIPQTKLSNFG